MNLRDALDAQITEKEFQAQIVQLARLEGWMVFHAYDMRRSTHGWPDLALLRNGRLGFLEVKTARGVVRPEQQQWIDELSKVNTIGAAIVRPKDWPTIETDLRRRP